MRITRRKALQGLAAAATTPILPGCGPGASPPSYSLALARQRIDTVVVLMMENRSFDHYFGAYSLEEGRSDVDGLTAAMTNPTLGGVPVGPSRADLNCILDPPHSWGAAHEQWNSGANDGFVRVHERRHGVDEAHRVMGYFGRQQLSAFYGLADQGAVLCQNWFASVMGPTWPNRYYTLMATSNGRQSNQHVNADLPSIFLRLDDKGLRWADYFGNVPFAVLTPRASLEQDEFKELELFFDDAASGTLPSFTLLEPLYGRNDDHPPTHPVAGQVLVQSIYNALAQSPQWERTLVIVTYDEHGGFFDHVSPPLTEDAFAADGFDQMGFRVPSLVMGPWVKQGAVSSEVFDHTSIIKTVTELYDLEGIGVRDGVAGSLLSLLDEQRVVDNRPAAPVQLSPITARDEELYAPECQAGLFHLSPGGRGVTNQPELEALIEARFPGHAKDRRHSTDRTYARLLDIARRHGALR